MKDDSKVRSLMKGLDVLEVINRTNGATVREVVQSTGINRGTVYRLLETLCEARFLERRANSNGYWLSIRIPSLSVGYRSDAWISQMAEPALGQLTAAFNWPCSLLIPFDTRMICLAHTEHISPMTFRKRDLGLAMSMFDTASGLTFLAYASPQARTTLLSSARTPQKITVYSAAVLRRTLKQIRSRGYHIVDSPDRGSVLSVPIIVGGLSFGVLALRYFTSAMTHAAAIRKYAAPLKATALKLGRDLERLDGSPAGARKGAPEVLAEQPQKLSKDMKARRQPPKIGAKSLK